MLTSVALPKLKNLDLSSNRLHNPQVIPELLEIYPSMQVLSIATNGISGKLILKRDNNSLRELNLQGNRITSMLLEGHYPKLKKLQMAVNLL
jgi:Leucine-rich repeat (LRR) protein